jgi:serine/threonine-protein kinase
MKYFIIISVLFCYGSLNAQKFDYYFDKGQMNLDTGNYKLAISYYDSALIKNPKHASSYFNRGLSKIIIEDNKGAILDFTKYIKLVPGDGDGYSQRGDARKYLKDTIG